MLNQIRRELSLQASAEKAAGLQRFFKTGQGEYGEGDKFYGITVPVQRRIAQTYQELSFPELKILLTSPIHEERLTALLILVHRYKKAEQAQQKAIFDFYFANISGVNNWDLVDLSAPQIVGHYLFAKDKKILRKLVVDQNLWKRRIAIVSTHYFIRNDRFSETIALAKKLLRDREDLLHKATGWMLREVGKRDVEVLEKFLRQFAAKMPRTMLRYAIEKFAPAKRKFFLEQDEDLI